MNDQLWFVLTVITTICGICIGYDFGKLNSRTILLVQVKEDKQNDKSNLN